VAAVIELAISRNNRNNRVRHNPKPAIRRWPMRFLN
jgi:hypothetical protein